MNKSNRLLILCACVLAVYFSAKVIRHDYQAANAQPRQPSSGEKIAKILLNKPPQGVRNRE